MPVRAEVTLYTRPNCGYCDRAREIFSKRGVKVEEINVEGHPEVEDWLMKKVRQKTIPQVFVNGRSIGGFTQLNGLENRGKLSAMLEDAPPDVRPGLPLSKSFPEAEATS